MGDGPSHAGRRFLGEAGLLVVMTIGVGLFSWHWWVYWLVGLFGVSLFSRSSFVLRSGAASPLRVVPSELHARTASARRAGFSRLWGQLGCAIRAVLDDRENDPQHDEHDGDSRQHLASPRAKAQARRPRTWR